MNFSLRTGIPSAPPRGNGGRAWMSAGAGAGAGVCVCVCVLSMTAGVTLLAFLHRPLGDT